MTAEIDIQHEALKALQKDFHHRINGSVQRRAGSAARRGETIYFINHINHIIPGRHTWLTK
ncbi:hypothetical protein [Gimesia sp.]|uniref:hypothetical protein n=1 Tax=Gimesia sp. TaxID=2024833 RepID=UPI003A951EB7